MATVSKEAKKFKHDLYIYVNVFLNILFVNIPDYAFNFQHFIIFHLKLSIIASTEKMS